MTAVEQPKKTIQVCKMALKRTEKSTYLVMSVIKDIEVLLKTSETETSARYKNTKGEGLVFYQLEDKLRKIQDKFNTSSYRHDRRVDLTSYGTAFFTENGYLNFSLLRTVGVGTGIKVDLQDLILEEECKLWMSEMGYFLKFLYMNFVNKIEVKANISINF